MGDARHLRPLDPRRAAPETPRRVGRAKPRLSVLRARQLHPARDWTPGTGTTERWRDRSGIEFRFGPTPLDRGNCRDDRDPAARDRVPGAPQDRSDPATGAGGIGDPPPARALFPVALSPLAGLVRFQLRVLRAAAGGVRHPGHDLDAGPRARLKRAG